MQRVPFPVDVYLLERITFAFRAYLQEILKINDQLIRLYVFAFGFYMLSWMCTTYTLYNFFL